MRKTHNPKIFPLQLKVSLLLIVLMAIGLSACGSIPTLSSSYTPDPADVDLAAWEAAYPAQFAAWEGSVHGEAYLSGDTNAATCNDCHESPEEGVTIKTAAFHLETPSRCARCHVDSDLMADYGIADDVVSTYLADFHGTTIQYYAETDPTAARDEAVCSDCHGSHAVYAADNELSSVNAANLDATCANCHAGAPEGFSSAYGHYRPVKSPASSSSDSTVVFIVKLAYQALIPIVLGGMVAYIALDIFFRIKRKSTAKKVEETTETTEESDKSEGQS